ncbi:MAG: SMC-Scp complex subunit ScpB [Clostridia bacterium]|nr:SMC-Scp complex subunit ScpB [Clostridia bacterium]
MDEHIIRTDGVQLDLAFDLEYLVVAAEAALFAVGSAIAHDKLAEAIDTRVEYIPIILEELKNRYKKRDTAIEVVIMKNYSELCTKSMYGDIVRKALEIRKNQPLSKAALEVLAVIAYNQPTTRAFVEKVRGVESPSVVATLAEKGLIEECGRLDTPGRPVLYATTPVFLRTFGLSSIEELGPAPQIDGVDTISGRADELLLLQQNSYHEDQLTFDENAFMVTVSPDEEITDEGNIVTSDDADELVNDDIFDLQNLAEQNDEE